MRYLDEALRRAEQAAAPVERVRALARRPALRPFARVWRKLRR